MKLVRQKGREREKNLLNKFQLMIGVVRLLLNLAS